MNSELQSSVIDGNKFIFNGTEIDYECSKNCYEIFQKGQSAGKFNIVDREDIRSAFGQAKVALRSNSPGWGRVPAQTRIDHLRRMSTQLKKRRNDIAKIIMWDTDKCSSQALQEFDEALKFLDDSIHVYTEWSETHKQALPIGVVLCWGPSIDSFLETFRLAIPALLTGNTVMIKIPCGGGLVHILTLETMQSELPDDVLQYLLGPPNQLIAPTMQTGDVSVLCYKGDRKTADKLIHAHPNPHRLRLQLEVDVDALVVITSDADIRGACEQMLQGCRRSHCVVNGRLIMVHVSVLQPLLQCLAEGLQEIRNEKRKYPPYTVLNPEQLQEMVIDALRKGAQVIDAKHGGGRLVPSFHGPIIQPAIVYPVNDTMQLWNEEFHGPIFPVVSYTTAEEVNAYLLHAPVHLQVSIFAESSSSMAGSEVVDYATRRVRSVLVNRLHEPPTGEFERRFLKLTRESTLREYPSSSSLSVLDPTSTSKKSGAGGSIGGMETPSVSAAIQGLSMSMQGSTPTDGQESWRVRPEGLQHDSEVLDVAYAESILSPISVTHHEK